MNMPYTHHKQGKPQKVMFEEAGCCFIQPY